MLTYNLSCCDLLSLTHGEEPEICWWIVVVVV